jgi:ribosomal 50S subunit-recycling heat shock protein
LRIDLALKYLCLAKSRSAVKSLCDEKAVWLNDRPAKPSSTVQINDTIRVTTRARIVTISLVNIPGKQLSKTLAPSYYRVIESDRLGQDDPGED